MRVSWRGVASARVRDDRGATAVILAVVLVVVIGVLALSVDGGLLWVKYRNIRNANDAASLAAALGCAGGDGLAAANTSANAAAAANASDATALEANVYTPNCNPNAGQVHVRYWGEQELMFGPAVGISSPKPVVASATAAWGAAGGSDSVVPLMISFRNTDCSIPNGVPPQTCHFWWDDDFPGLSTFGLMNLSTWGYTAGQTCPSGSGSANLNEAVDTGWPEPLILTSNPTYVCSINNNSVHANVASHVNAILPHQFMFPVNSSTQQIPPCAAGATTCLGPNKYAIIGFAEMTITNSIVNNNRAATLCAPLNSPGSGGNFRCVEAVWTGWNASGYVPGGGASFGTVAVALKD